MDLKRVQELLRLMEEHGLAEIEVEDKGLKIRLKKETAAAAAPGAAPTQSPAAPPGPQAGAAAATEPPEEANAYTVTSPIVGTFYLAASADAELFVEVGDPVEADTVVCIVEAMKVMNEVKAEVSGSILKVLVENGKPVEYGQPLFLVSKQ